METFKKILFLVFLGVFCLGITAQTTKWRDM